MKCEIGNLLVLLLSILFQGEQAEVKAERGRSHRGFKLDERNT
jgi:hypothetical protein